MWCQFLSDQIGAGQLDMRRESMSRGPRLSDQSDIVGRFWNPRITVKMVIAYRWHVNNWALFACRRSISGFPVSAAAFYTAIETASGFSIYFQHPK